MARLGSIDGKQKKGWIVGKDLKKLLQELQDRSGRVNQVENATSFPSYVQMPIYCHICTVSILGLVQGRAAVEAAIKSTQVSHLGNNKYDAEKNYVVAMYDFKVTFTR